MEPPPDINPVEILPPPGVPWTMWLVGALLLLAALAVAARALRKFAARKPLAAPPPHPAVRALHALAAIPDAWPTERAAAAGAHILRAYLAVIGLGPGVAHPARDFAGLRSADGWRGLIALLAEMEALACTRFPSRHTWLQAREQAALILQQTPWPDGPPPPPPAP